VESRKEGILRHLAVIMDGNGRWAKKRHLSREFGHRRGAENLRTLCILCREREIQYLTVYAFSTENWKRPATEVSALMSLVIRVFRQYMDELEKRGFDSDS
jgi:undecaprenyl diphosphate synthase